MHTDAASRTAERRQVASPTDDFFMARFAAPFFDMSVPRLTFPPDSVSRTVLPNGLTVLLHIDRSAPVAAVVTYVRAGYFDEPHDVVGIAHVLEHMYFKGTPSRGVG